MNATTDTPLAPLPFQGLLAHDLALLDRARALTWRMIHPRRCVGAPERLETVRAWVHWPREVRGTVDGGWRVGTSVGPFVLERWLGSGGMGEVWCALDTRLERRVALKRLRGEPGAEAWERFLREARLQARIRSPNVATLYDVGGLDRGEPYLVMELVEGWSLAALLREGPLPVERALEITRGIAAGLAAAHRVGVIHRDLKPGNVLLTPEGTPVLVDFGVALLVSAASAQGPPGEIVGTPDWMAPEQVAGRELGPAADVWAVGVMLFQMLTGEHPFPGASPLERVAATVTGPPRDVRELRPDVPGPVARLIAGCLERDPDRRIRSGEELLQRIPVPSVPVAVREPHLLAPDVVAEAAVHPPLGRRRLALAAVAGVVGVAVAVAAGVEAWGRVVGRWLRPAEAVAVVRELAGRAGVVPRPLHAAAGYVLLGGHPVLWVRLSPGPLLDPDRPPHPSWPPPHRAGEVRALLDPRGGLLRWDWWPEAGRKPRLAPLLEALGSGGGASPRGPAGEDPRGVALTRLRTPSGRDIVVGTLDGAPVVAAREGVGPPPVLRRLGTPAASLGMLLLVGVGTVAGWRRWRAREGDLRGAVALAGAVVVLHSLKLVTNPVTFITGIWLDQLLLSVGVGVVLGIVYLGAEPPVRSLWPGAISGWIHLLRGELTRPEVWRGAAVGAAAALPAGLACLGVAAAGWAGPPEAATLGAGAWGLWGFGLAMQAERAVVLAFLMLLLAAWIGRVTRRPWLALAASAALLGPALLWPGAAGPGRAVLAGVSAVLVPAVVREGGFLALAVVGCTLGFSLQVLPPAAGGWTVPFTAVSVGVALLPAILAGLAAAAPARGDTVPTVASG